MPTAIALIHRLYAADQQERAGHAAFDAERFRALRENDAARRAALRRILVVREVNDGLSLYRAAMVFLHGESLEDIDAAHRLALRSAEAGYRPARWLAASSMDRWLMYQGLPQKYGTQVVSDGKRQRLWHFEPTTTDEMRREWDVPVLSWLQGEAERITREEPVPPVDNAPAWQQDGIARWKEAGDW